MGGVDPAGPPPGFRAPLFESLEALVEGAQPDWLAILTPPSSHADLVHRGLRAGCHVFCEKPLTPDLPTAKTLIDLALSSDRHLVVNQEFRFMEQHQAAHRALGGKDLGDLLFLEARQTFFTDEGTESGWRGQEERRTCQEFGIHVLDLCRFFFGEEPEKIYARMPRPRGGPDLLNLIQLDFPGERSAQIVLDRLSRGRHDYLDLRLDGTRGVVETHLGGRVEVRGGLRGGSRRPFLELDVAGGGRARLYQGERFRTLGRDPLSLFATATQRLLEAVFEALRQGKEPPCLAADHLRSLALVEAAYESDRLGLPLHFDWREGPSWSVEKRGSRGRSRE